MLERFDIKLNWDTASKGFQAHIDRFVGELERLQHIDQIISQATRDQEVLGTLDARSQEGIKNLARGEIERDAAQSPQELLENVKSRILSIDEERDRRSDSIGKVLGSVASLVGKGAAATAGAPIDAAGIVGGLSEAYGSINDIRKALRTDAGLDVGIARVLRIYYSNEVRRSAGKVLASFQSTSKSLMEDVFAYSSHFKDFRLEQNVSSRAAQSALRNYNDPVKMAAGKAINTVHDHFAPNRSHHPLLSIMVNAVKNATRIERASADPFQTMPKAGWLVKMPTKSQEKFVSDFVEDAVQKGPQATRRQLNRDVEALETALLELQIPQDQAFMMEERYRNGSPAAKQTVLFDEHEFVGGIKDVLGSDPSVVRRPTPVNEAPVEKWMLRQELLLARDIVRREGLKTPRLRQVSDEDVATIEEIGKMLHASPERMTHVTINCARDQDRKFFPRLKEDVREASMRSSADRKASLQLSVWGGQRLEVATNRRLDN